MSKPRTATPYRQDGADHEEIGKDPYHPAYYEVAEVLRRGSETERKIQDHLLKEGRTFLNKMSQAAYTLVLKQTVRLLKHSPSPDEKQIVYDQSRADTAHTLANIFLDEGEVAFEKARKSARTPVKQASFAQRLRRLGRGDPAGLNVTVTSRPDPHEQKAATEPLAKIKERADTLMLALKLQSDNKEVDETIQKLNKQISGAKQGLEQLAKLLSPEGQDAGMGLDSLGDDGGGGFGMEDTVGGGTDDDGGTLKQTAVQEITDALTEASQALASTEQLAAYLKSVQDESRKNAKKSPSEKGKPGKSVPVKPAPESKPQKADKGSKQSPF